MEISSKAIVRRYKILSDDQYRFRANRSTSDILSYEFSIAIHGDWGVFEFYATDIQHGILKGFCSSKLN